MNIQIKFFQTEFKKLMIKEFTATVESLLEELELLQKLFQMKSKKF